MIPKYIQAKDNSWVMVSELPGEGQFLMLEGMITEHEGEFRSQRIIFSLEAIKQFVPLMQEWLEEKDWEDIHKEDKDK